MKRTSRLWVSLLIATQWAFCMQLRAAEFYLDQGNPTASDYNPGSAALPWKSIAKANLTLSPGDTVYIKRGSYSDYIAPARSGTALSPITYRNYSNDVVTVQNTSYGIHLDGKSRIIVQGITFTNLDQMMILENSANNNVIAYCNFVHMRNLSSWSGSRIWFLSSYNWVHHCVFSDWGYCSGGVATGSVLEIGWDDGDATYPGNYNLIENCTIFNGGHHTLGVHGNHNVIRNNYTYNAAWTAGKGERTLYLNGYSAYCNRNLIEGNRIGYSDVPCDTWGAPGAQVSSEWNIFRKNYFFFNNLSALQFSTTDSYHANGPNHNYVYNNTFMRNGWQTDSGSDDQQRSQIGFQNWSTLFTVKWNVIKNNLFYQAVRLYGYNGALASDQTFANNYNGDTAGNPLFVNATSTPGSPVNTSYPDLSLQSNSPAINAGGFLTTITSAAGSGTSFVVADPNYFMDGWGIVQGDLVQLQGTTQQAQITKVDYVTGVVTVNSSLTWSQGQGVALGYQGAAPDIGAFEFGAAAPPASTNPAPVVTTMATQTVGFPTNAIALSASATDPNADPLTFNWSQLSGPAAASLSVTNGTNTVVSVLVRGTYGFRFAASDGRTTSFADTTITFAPATNTIALEAESGNVTSPFVVQNGYIVQNLQTSVTNGGRAAYSFTLSQAGNFVVTAFVNAPNDGANSLYVNVDAEPADPAMIWDIPITAGFEERAVFWRGSTSASDPQVFALSAGAHTLIIRGREAGVQLDRIDITKIVSTVAPLLGILPVGNKVVLSWPVSATSYILETSSSLPPNASWTPLTNGLGTSGDRTVLTNILNGRASFYRLRQQ